MSFSEFPANPLPFKIEGTNNLEPYLTEREAFFESMAIVNGYTRLIKGDKNNG